MHVARFYGFSDRGDAFARLPSLWLVDRGLSASGAWSSWFADLVSETKQNSFRFSLLQPYGFFISVTEIETYSESFLQVTDISTPWSGSNILIKWPYWYLGLHKSRTEKSLADRHFVVLCMGEDKLVRQSYTRTQNKFVPVMALPSLPGVRLILV